MEEGEGDEEGKRRKKILGKVSGTDKISNIEKRISRISRIGFILTPLVIYRLDIGYCHIDIIYIYTIWIIPCNI